MNVKYRYTKTTVSMINYHFVFCPRYRRKIFLIDGVEPRFRELVSQTCRENNIEILNMECHIDFCYLHLNVSPEYSPADIMRLIKSNTSRPLREEFDVLKYAPTIWTRSYFVSTANRITEDTIKRYVNEQKTRS